MALGQAAIDAGFEVFGVAATYTPPGSSSAASCRVIMGGADADQQALGSRFVVNQMTIEVRASEIAAPARDGVFIVDAESFTIVQAPRREDRDRAIWTCLCKIGVAP